MKETHKIEKGLSLKAPRQGFGKETIQRIIIILETYLRRFGHDTTMLSAVNALNSYRKVPAHSTLLSADQHSLIERVLSQSSQNNKEATLNLLKKDILSFCSTEEKFFTSRHSLREFSNVEVSDDDIKKAISFAIYTPSACNRQEWRVRILKDSRKDIALKYQNGNSGFTDQISKLLLVTCDIRSLTTISERNQGWIDGGMFSMSLVYALHSLGLGTCCLNLCLSGYREFQFRRDLNLPNHEQLIMLIAVGHIPDRITVARSIRYSIEHTLLEEPHA